MVVAVSLDQGLRIDDRRASRQEIGDLLLCDCGQGINYFAPWRIWEPFKLDAAGVHPERHELLAATEHLDLPETTGQDDLGRLADRCPVEHEAAGRALARSDRRLSEHIDRNGAALMRDATRRTVASGIGVPTLAVC
jgi:hypothetical protein